MPILRPTRSLGGHAPEPRGHTSSGLPRQRLSRVLRGRHRFWYRAGMVSLVLAGLGTIAVVGLVAWVSQDLPDPNNLNTRVVAQSTKIYARDGSTLLYEIHGAQRRTIVDLKDISPFVKPATLSIEDKTFYQHGGISLRGILRSIFVDVLSGRKSQGGSTITQQLVKNSILTSEKSFTRKIKELILAYQIERRFSKDQILKLYFNEIPYGSNAYGVEAAAQTYFNKHAKGLDLAQSALLAAMVQAPSHYSPTGSHRDELISRQHYVLSLMVGQGYITQAEADAAKAVDVLKEISPFRDPVVAPHFVFYVRDQLIQKYGDVVVERGGLRVITTLDPKMQAIAEDEVAKGAQKNETKSKASNAALVAIDPKTGQVLAMVGSRNYFDTEHDGNFNVATAVRNPGSSFKPVVYLTAFTRGYSPDTMLFDLKTNFGPDGSGKDFSPNNYDFKEHGPLKMRQTLAGSLNIPAVKTLYLAGISNVLDLADKLGYTTFDRSKVGLALAIGGGGVKLIEHVGAFSVLANEGMRNPVTTIRRVEDKNGKVLEEYTPTPTRVVDQGPVRQLVDVMSDNSARAFVFGSKNPLTLLNRPVAAKTGTTNDFKDGWTIGFTPSLAAGVWAGNNNNSPMRGGSDGVVVAGPIWHAFMERALQGTPVDRFVKPRPVNATKPVLGGKLQGDIPINVDAQTGKQIPDSCLASWPKDMVKKVTVKEVHTILFYVNKDDPNGPAPDDPTKDPMFARWEAPVQAWAKKNNDVAKMPDLESCSLRGAPTALSVTFAAPIANATVAGDSVDVSIVLAPDDGASSAQYTLDGVAVGGAVTTPYSTSIPLVGVTNGFHTVGVTVTDAVGATVAATTTINILSKTSAQSMYFISPTSRATVAATGFPMTVRAFVFDPSGVTNVTLSLKAPDGTITVVDTINAPADQVVDFSWSTTPPGTYDLFLTEKNKKGASFQSDLLRVTVS